MSKRNPDARSTPEPPLTAPAPVKKSHDVPKQEAEKVARTTSRKSPRDPAPSADVAKRAHKPRVKSRSRPSATSPSGLSWTGTRVIAVANQKGGVGKSTTAVSLGAALAELGYRVLVVDLDPQGNASTGLGIGHEARAKTVYDVLAADAPIEGAIISTPVAGLFAIPSTIDLAGAEIELVSQFSRELRLRKALEPLREGPYDFVFLDCPPSLGLLTVNALAAAQELLVPIQCEYYALEGLGQLLRNVRLVQQNVNPQLRLTGIVMTMFDTRTKLSEQVVNEVRRYFGDRVYEAVIPRTVRLSEAPGFGQPITVYDPKSRGAESYRALARELAERQPEGEPLPVFDELPTVIVTPPSPKDQNSRREAEPEERQEDLEELRPQAHRNPDPTEEETVPAQVEEAEAFPPDREPDPVGEAEAWLGALGDDGRAEHGGTNQETDESAGSAETLGLSEERESPVAHHAEAAAPAPERSELEPAATEGDGTEPPAPRRRWRLFRKGGNR